MDENELRRKMQAGELAANNGTVMRTLAIAGCDFKFLRQHRTICKRHFSEQQQP